MNKNIVYKIIIGVAILGFSAYGFDGVFEEENWYKFISCWVVIILLGVLTCWE